jgi:hypothetical protein
VLSELTVALEINAFVAFSLPTVALLISETLVDARSAIAFTVDIVVPRIVFMFAFIPVIPLPNIAPDEINCVDTFPPARFVALSVLTCSVVATILPAVNVFVVIDCAVSVVTNNAPVIVLAVERLRIVAFTDVSELICPVADDTVPTRLPGTVKSPLVLSQ